MALIMCIRYGLFFIFYKLIVIYSSPGVSLNTLILGMQPRWCLSYTHWYTEQHCMATPQSMYLFSWELEIYSGLTFHKQCNHEHFAQISCKSRNILTDRSIHCSIFYVYVYIHFTNLFKWSGFYPPKDGIWVSIALYLCWARDWVNFMLVFLTSWL